MSKMLRCHGIIASFPRLLGDLLYHTFSHFTLFFPFLFPHMTLLLSLTCVSLSQQVSLAWCYGACCPFFPVLSTPSCSRQMAALLGSGSDGGFFLLKGSFFIPQLPHVHSGWEIGLKRSFSANCWFP